MPEERYIHEMPLVVTPRQAKVLDQRFEAARMIYNAALQEGLKRLRLMRESKDWNKARALKKACKKKKANALYRDVCRRFKFSDYELQKVSFLRNDAPHMRIWLIRIRLRRYIAAPLETRLRASNLFDSILKQIYLRLSYCW